LEKGQNHISLLHSVFVWQFNFILFPLLLGAGSVFLFLAIYRQISTLKKPWLRIRRGVFILNRQKATAILFGGVGDEEGIATFMCSRCSFKSSSK
jgi:hypothetical protein